LALLDRARASAYTKADAASLLGGCVEQLTDRQAKQSQQNHKHQISQTFFLLKKKTALAQMRDNYKEAKRVDFAHFGERGHKKRAPAALREKQRLVPVPNAPGKVK
jgi:hypothetical protein